MLDFSRSVHEDLSNFDLNGAWVWLLDDFVEYMKKARQTRCGWAWGWAAGVQGGRARGGVAGAGGEVYGSATRECFAGALQASFECCGGQAKSWQVLRGIAWALLWR